MHLTVFVEEPLVFQICDIVASHKIPSQHVSYKLYALQNEVPPTNSSIF